MGCQAGIPRLSCKLRHPDSEGDCGFPSLVTSIRWKGAGARMLAGVRSELWVWALCGMKEFSRFAEGKALNSSHGSVSA